MNSVERSVSAIPMDVRAVIASDARAAIASGIWKFFASDPPVLSDAIDAALDDFVQRLENRVEEIGTVIETNLEAIGLGSDDVDVEKLATFYLLYECLR